MLVVFTVMKRMPVKILLLASSYIFWLIALTASLLMSVDRDSFLKYAMDTKPYSAIFQKEALAINHEANHPTLICFGDSCYYFPNDRRLNFRNFDRHIPGLLSQQLNRAGSESSIKVVEWAYPGAGLKFDYYCMFFRAKTYKPDLILIPINWRSFSHGWLIQEVDHPELCSFVPLRARLTPEIDDFLRENGISLIKHLESKLTIFAFYVTGMKLSVKEKLLHPSAGENEKKEGNNEADLQMEQQMMDLDVLVYNYPSSLNASNPTLRGFTAFLEEASRNRQKVLFYIYPELLQTSDLYKRAAFDASKERLIELVKKHNSNSIQIYDLFELLPHDLFYDQWGHFTLEGRRKLAEALAPKVREMIVSDGGELNPSKR
jgi:hypothetical protein